MCKQKGSNMSQVSFESFRDLKLKEGFDQVLIRPWEPHFSNEPHTHPFDTQALVVQGEYWLTVGDESTHFKTGDTFSLDRGVLHSEKYGSQGATFWAARKE